jgi:hypothetical protein
MSMNSLDENGIDVSALPRLLNDGYSHWKAIRGDRDLPLRKGLDPVNIPRLLDHIVLVQVLRDPETLAFEDFEFRLLGAYLDDRMLASYRRKKLSELPHKGPGSEVWKAYMEVVRTKKPLTIRQNYIGTAQHIKNAFEIYLPLSNTGELVDFVYVVIDLR